MHRWEKRYSFRLTKTESEVGDYIETVPSNKRSEVIRQLLVMGYKAQFEEKENNPDGIPYLQELVNEIQGLKNTQLMNHNQIMDQLKHGVLVNIEDQEEKEDTMSDEVLKEGAMAFMQSFGMD